jgi:Ni,Fe-hydrogenase I cytochrome b subunit
MDEQHYKAYPVWDLPVRIFHWVNFICVISLIAIGTVILYAKPLGLDTDGKILIKTVHVLVGYVFVINLALRLLWAFMGNRFSRWGSFLPLGSDYAQQLKSYIAAEKSGQPHYYLGHNPKGRLAVTVLFLVLTTMAVTGLVLAGTDIYFPPFGGVIQEWVAANGVNPADIAPYVKDNVDAEAFKEMRVFRKPFITTHYWVFFAVLAAIAVHVGAVVYTEIKTGGGIISAMFSGKKVFPRDPEDQ